MLNLRSAAVLSSCITRRHRLLSFRVAPSPLAHRVRLGFRHRGPDCEILTHKFLQQGVQRYTFLIVSLNASQNLDLFQPAFHWARPYSSGMLYLELCAR